MSRRHKKHSPHDQRRRRKMAKRARKVARQGTLWAAHQTACQAARQTSGNQAAQPALASENRRVVNGATSSPPPAPPAPPAPPLAPWQTVRCRKGKLPAEVPGWIREQMREINQKPIPCEVCGVIRGDPPNGTLGMMILNHETHTIRWFCEEHMGEGHEAWEVGLCD
jgi:hypothetical protein